MKLAILGEKKSILGFKALGIETFGIANRDDVQQALTEIEKNQYAILFVTEEIIDQYTGEIESLYQKTLPAILVIPGVSSKVKKGKEALKKIVERALGSEMVKI